MEGIDRISSTDLAFLYLHLTPRIASDRNVHIFHKVPFK
jgi:hypothetical protein